MAIEIRRIILERHEVQAVLNVFAQLEDSGLPNGFVVGFEVEAVTPLKILVNVQTTDGGQVNVELEEDAIVHALIHFCIKTKIPVSRKSKKTVKYSDEKFSFDMSLINSSFASNI